MKEEFERDTKNHEMKVIYDNGDENRSIEFRNRNAPSSFCYRLTTFRDHLVYAGGEESFVFKLTPDMFDFFGHLNYKYYGEQLLVGKWSEFDLESSKASLIERIKSLEDNRNNELISDIFFLHDCDEQSFYEDTYRAMDMCGINTYYVCECIIKNPTRRFKWSIMAINKGIKMYKESKA